MMMVFFAVFLGEPDSAEISGFLVLKSDSTFTKHENVDITGLYHIVGFYPLQFSINQTTN